MLNNAETKNIIKKEEKSMKIERNLIARVLYRERRFPVMVVDEKATKTQVASIAHLIDEATDHNFVAGKDLIVAMGDMSVSELKAAFDSFMAAYSVATGSYVDMNKFTAYQDYPNFAMNGDMIDILINQYISYVADAVDRVFGTNLHAEIFDREIIERGEDADDEYETVHSTILRPGTQADAMRIVNAMIASRINLNADDAELLKAVLNAMMPEDILAVLPKKIEQKTTLRLVATVLLDKGMALDVLGIKNSVDAIRLAHELSSSNVNRFDLSNRERMAILELINKDQHANANMFSHREDFLRLGEYLHPRKYAKRFPVAAQAFAELRSKTRTEQTFMSQYNQALAEGDVLAAAKALSFIPGKFVQELDALLSLAMDVTRQKKILEIFKAVAANAPAKRLFQCYTHFKNRNADGEKVERYTLDRYSRPIEYVKEFLPISQEILDAAADAALEAFKTTKASAAPKKYFINEERFSKAIIDKSGSRIAIRDTDWLRLFVYWVGQDVDLTAVFLDEEFGYKDQVSWQHLRSGKQGDALAIHSVDVTYAPNGGNEYIDINREKAKLLAETDGYRYIAIINVVYSGPAFQNMPNAFTGVMALQNPDIGDVFKPGAVATKAKIKSGRGNLAFLYDIVEDEVILINADITPKDESSRWGITVRNCFDEIVAACKAVVGSEKYDLCSYLNAFVAATDGEIVADKADADVIFDEDGIDIFDDMLYSEYI